MTPRSTTLVVILVGAVVALSTTLGMVLARPGLDEASPDLTPIPVNGTQLDEGFTPALSTNEEAAVKDLAVADEAFKKLLGDRKFEIGEVAVWHQSNGRVIGGVVDVVLAEPGTISGTWVSKKGFENPDGDFSYETVAYEATWEDVDLINVFVDLASKRVVKIRPGGHARIVGEPPAELIATPEGGVIQ